MGRGLWLACLGAAMIAACGQADAPALESGDASDRIVLLSADGFNLATSCSGCHMPGGGALADISDYDEVRLAATLRAYKSDADGTTVMHRLARGYSDEQIQHIAMILGAPAP